MDLRKLKKPTNNSKIPIILFFNGTFAPIHDGNDDVFLVVIFL